MKIVFPTKAGIEEAAQALRRGEIVAYPTETVYGLGVDPFSIAAIDRMYAAKARDAANPVLLIAADEDHVTRVARAISPVARTYMDAFWPGPLSLILPAATGLPPMITGPGDTICVRRTSSPIAADLCRAFGGAITSTSANLSGQTPARTAQEIRIDGVSVVIDGGHLGEALPSTVFDPESGVIHREGAIFGSMIAQALTR